MKIVIIPKKTEEDNEYSRYEKCGHSWENLQRKKVSKNAGNSSRPKDPLYRHDKNGVYVISREAKGINQEIQRTSNSIRTLFENVKKFLYASPDKEVPDEEVYVLVHFGGDISIPDIQREIDSQWNKHDARMKDPYRYWELLTISNYNHLPEALYPTPADDTSPQITIPDTDEGLSDLVKSLRENLDQKINMNLFIISTSSYKISSS